MNKSNKLIAGRIIPAIISVVLLVAFDQLTKYIVINNIELYGSVPLISDVLELHYIRNSGAAWGIFQNKQIMFYIITVIFLFFCAYVYIKCAQNNLYKDLRVLIILISSGAIGNFIDRIRQQYVVDFIYFKLINFPVFNVADCYVTISVFLLIFLMIFKYKEDDFDLIFKKHN